MQSIFIVGAPEMNELVKIPINYLFKYSINISLNKIILVILFFGLIQNVADAQTLPNKIKNYLDANYTNTEDGAWRQVRSACDGNKSVLTGDFDGDGQTDYLVRIKTGKTPQSLRLFLIAFFNRNGEFTPEPFYEEAFTDDILRSSSVILKKGTTVSLGLGAEDEGPNLELKTDAVAQYICETDAAKTFIYRDGEMKDIQEVSIETTPTTAVNSEQKCFNLVQGKVAWNKTGSTNWNEANVRNLCQGTTQPEVRIDCFKEELQKSNNWQTAMNVCKSRLETKITQQTPITPNNPTPNNKPLSNQTPTTGNKMADEILAVHNKYRAEVGVAPLKWSETLANSAQKWADELAKNRKFNHSRMGENLWGGSAKGFSYTQMVEG